MIVFGHHRSMLDGIQHRLGAAGRAMRIDGSTSMEMRKKGMDDFQQKPSVRLAILSITAAGVSHVYKLQKYVSSYIYIYYDFYVICILF